MTKPLDTFYGSTCPAYFSATSAIWPDSLNHPASAFIRPENINTLLNHPDSKSVSGFAAYVQEQLEGGYDKIEVVSRKVLETAKKCLSNAQTLLWQMDNWFSKGVSVLNQTCVMNGIGAALMAIGALGIHFAKPEKEDSSRKIRYLSYSTFISGLSLVALSCYRVNSISQYIQHIATKLPS